MVQIYQSKAISTNLLRSPQPLPIHCITSHKYSGKNSSGNRKRIPANPDYRNKQQDNLRNSINKKTIPVQFPHSDSANKRNR